MSDDKPDALAVLIDRFAVTDIIHEFHRLVDTNRASSTASLFADDAELTFRAGSPSPGTVRGAEITTMMDARERLADVTTRHVVSNLAFAHEAGDRIRATYLLTLFRSDGGPPVSDVAFVADVDELFVRRSGRWKISARSVGPIFLKPKASLPPSMTAHANDRVKNR